MAVYGSCYVLFKEIYMTCNGSKDAKTVAEKHLILVMYCSHFLNS